MKKLLTVLLSLCVILVSAGCSIETGGGESLCGCHFRQRRLYPGYFGKSFL